MSLDTSEPRAASAARQTPEQTRQEAEPGMLAYLRDPANAITAGGLVLSATGLNLALAGRLELAVAVALWAMLADHLDGVVAKRTKNRPPEMGKMGKSLDGFADLVYGAVFPAVVVIMLAEQSLPAAGVSIAMLFVGAVRLSYFANFGLSSDGRFMGVPLSYDVPLLAVLFLVRPRLPAEAFGLLVLIAFLVLAGLHVAPIRVPSMNRAAYTGVTLFSVVASVALVMRGGA